VHPVVGEARPGAIRVGDRRAGGAVDAEVLVSDGAGGDAVGCDRPRVGGHQAVHDALAEPPGGLDPHGVAGERDACHLGVDQALHQHRHLRVPGLPSGTPVGHGPLRPQRLPARPHLLDDRGRTPYAEKAVVLPGRRRVGRVFGAGRRPDGHRHVAQPVRGDRIDHRVDVGPGRDDESVGHPDPGPHQVRQHSGLAAAGGGGGRPQIDDHVAAFNILLTTFC
jgi:hypothetical protein